MSSAASGARAPRPSRHRWLWPGPIAACSRCCSTPTRSAAASSSSSAPRRSTACGGTTWVWRTVRSRPSRWPRCCRAATGLATLSWGRDGPDEVPAALGGVLAAAVRGFDLVVADVPRHLEPAGAELVARSVLTVVVVPEEVRAVGSARRVLGRLEPHTVRRGRRVGRAVRRTRPPWRRRGARTSGHRPAPARPSPARCRRPRARARAVPDGARRGHHGARPARPRPRANRAANRHDRGPAARPRSAPTRRRHGRADTAERRCRAAGRAAADRQRHRPRRSSTRCAARPSASARSSRCWPSTASPTSSSTDPTPSTSTAAAGSSTPR